MLVVSDTSPLNYLVLIGLDSILPALFTRVVTVPAVMDELAHAHSPKQVRTWAAVAPQWLEVLAPKALDPSLHLGLGETQAISLASELRADAVLIDERKGAQAATKLGLFVTGTLGVLQIGEEKGLVQMDAAVAALRTTTFRASEKLLDELLQRSAQRARKSDPGG